MKCIRRDELEPRALQGRQLWRIYGDDSAVADRRSFGFAHFAPQFGDMRPHHHEREWIYVLDAKHASARYGEQFSAMDTERTLRAGDFLRFEDGECHVFTFSDPEGYLDILWGFELPMNHTVEAKA